MIAKIILTVVVIVALLGGIKAYFVVRAAQQLAHTLLYPQRIRPQQTPADFGFADWEDVRFENGELELAGWFIPPAEGADGATLILLHGWSANRSELLDQAQLLHRHGYGILAIDLRGHGDSGAAASTWGLAEVSDVQAGVDYLLTRPEVDPERLGVVGHSMGAATAILAAAQIPRLKVVVAESSYTALTDNLANIINLLGGYPAYYAPLVLRLMERDTGLSLGEIQPIAGVARISPRAVLLVQGEADTVVNPGHARRLFEAAAEPKQLYLVPGAGHGEVFSADPAGFEQQVVPFLDKYLGQQAQ
ncbi:MAG: hypothetical protein FOGNACKC_02710 [Anaerolineae bacterium]|nr:hypothetical protein [Anaerolineae bacterium]